jgi:hypothetical protein
MCSRAITAALDDPQHTFFPDFKTQPIDTDFGGLLLGRALNQGDV